MPRLKKRIIADISLAKSPKDDGLDTDEIVEEAAQSIANVLHDMVEEVLRPAAKIAVVSIVTVTAVSAVCKIAVKSTKTN